MTSTTGTHGDRRRMHGSMTWTTSIPVTWRPGRSRGARTSRRPRPSPNLPAPRNPRRPPLRPRSPLVRRKPRARSPTSNRPWRSIVARPRPPPATSPSATSLSIFPPTTPRPDPNLRCRRSAPPATTSSTRTTPPVATARPRPMRTSRTLRCSMTSRRAGAGSAAVATGRPRTNTKPSRSPTTISRTRSRSPAAAPSTSGCCCCASRSAASSARTDCRSCSACGTGRDSAVSSRCSSTADSTPTTRRSLRSSVRWRRRSPASWSSSVFSPRSARRPSSARCSSPRRIGCPRPAASNSSPPHRGRSTSCSSRPPRPRSSSPVRACTHWTTRAAGHAGRSSGRSCG